MKDYEKKYNDALERAKSIHNNPNASKSRKEWIEDIFPELAESEDERTRKDIYKLMLGMREEIFTSQDEIVTKGGVLAYLEKQKENSKSADSFTDACRDVIVAIEKYLDWLTGYPDYAPKGKYSLRDMLYCLSLLEKKKEPENVSATTMAPSCWAEEQKPTEIAPNQFDGITYGMQGHSTDRPADRFEEAREKYQVEWSKEEAAGEYASDSTGFTDMTAYRAFIAGWKCRDDQMPMPEDTVLFNKGVAEGRRLEREDILGDAILCEVDWYDGPILNYPIDQLCEVLSKMGVDEGDKVRIVVLKEEE